MSEIPQDLSSFSIGCHPEVSQACSQVGLGVTPSKEPFLINPRWRQLFHLCPSFAVYKPPWEHLWHFITHNYGCVYFPLLDKLREDRNLALLVFLPIAPMTMLNAYWINIEVTHNLYHVTKPLRGQWGTCPLFILYGEQLREVKWPVFRRLVSRPVIADYCLSQLLLENKFQWYSSVV